MGRPSGTSSSSGPPRPVGRLYSFSVNDVARRAEIADRERHSILAIDSHVRSVAVRDGLSLVRDNRVQHTADHL